MSRDFVKIDDASRAALQRLQAELASTRQEIIIHTQFRRVTATSPLDPGWGQPNPIDIGGIIERCFVEGIRYANEVNSRAAGGEVPS